MKVLNVWTFITTSIMLQITYRDCNLTPDLTILDLNGTYHFSCYTLLCYGTADFNKVLYE